MLKPDKLIRYVILVIFFALFISGYSAAESVGRANLLDNIVVLIFERNDEINESVLTFVKANETIAKRIYRSGSEVYSEGKIPDGVVIELYASGRIKNVIPFINGVRHGSGISYYESGTIKGETDFKLGEPYGVGKLYHENGQIKVKSKYVDGKLVYYREYDEKGNLIIQPEIKNRK